MFSNFKTKTNSSFAVKVTKEATSCFESLFDESRFSDTCTIMELEKNLIDCVNIWKTSEVANLAFQWTFSVKQKFFHVGIVKEISSSHVAEFPFQKSSICLGWYFVCIREWDWDRSSRPEVFCKKVVLRNLTNFTGTHLKKTHLKKRLWH